ncbi:hypothetical protein Sjap_002650 [Stephania japonica]|uniref:Uncharacterized protein n=1 Tax=Stephania japonica TaxID=461633 RepID=A0AAP0PUB7_9MAGN
MPPLSFTNSGGGVAVALLQWHCDDATFHFGIVFESLPWLVDLFPVETDRRRLSDDSAGQKWPLLCAAVVLSSDPEMRFRYQIVMAYQRGPSDNSRTSSTRAVSIEEFQSLTQRVVAQERQLEKILAILRTLVAIASVPSTARVTVTQEANTSGVTTMTLLPTTTATRTVMAVVPRAAVEIAPATSTVYGTTMTIEARQ